MKNDNDSSGKTSRRQFTKAVVTAAVSVPIAATLACKTNDATPADRAKATATPEPCGLIAADGNGYKKITWERLPPEDHIPPMGFEGGGSLIVDSKNILRETGSGNGPYTYDEDPAIITVDKRYGDIKEVTVIIEESGAPYLSHSFFNSFQPGAQLFIWYQNIVQQPTGDDTDYEGIATEPDLKVNGGRGNNPFKIYVKQKKFNYDKSHRKNRPHRYRHANIGNERHFRIAKWQVLNAANTVMFEHNGADNYRLYVTFGHYQ